MIRSLLRGYLWLVFPQRFRMFFKGKVLYLLRNSVGSTLLEIIHPLHNIIVFLELLLKEGVNITDGFGISILIMLSSCVLDLLVVMQLQLSEDIF